MKLDLSPYKRKGKVALGDSLKVLFENKSNTDDCKVLELNRVAGYFDNYEDNEILQWLRLDDSVGAYGDDLSMRLKKFEIVAYKEVYLFKDKQCIDYNFHAVAEKIEFRDLNENDKWLK